MIARSTEPVPETGSKQKATASLRRPVAGGILLGLFLAVVAEVVRMLLGANFHIIMPGELYRSGQPSPALLARLVSQYGIRTVINLRGDFEPPEEYQAERRCVRDLHLDYQEAGLWSSLQPTVPEACRLVDALDRATPPVLLHCGGGSDRTGLATTLFLLLRTDTDLPRARMQLSIRYGHFPLGPAVAMDRFVDKYERWLESTGQTHSADRLRWWVRHEYQPGRRW
jgi:protein tyrosine phosphatase (PTP) superfamily phosphohydrolase (DUF442 family)